MSPRRLCGLQAFKQHTRRGYRFRQCLGPVVVVAVAVAVAVAVVVVVVTAIVVIGVLVNVPVAELAN